MDDFYFEDEENQLDGGMDLRRYWKALLGRWWLWSLITILITVPWAYFVKQEKTLYEANARIQFKSFDRSEERLAASRQQILASRTFAEQVVAELGLVLEFEPVDDDSIIRRKQIFDTFSTTGTPRPGNYVLAFQDTGVFDLLVKDTEVDRNLIKVISGEIEAAKLDTVKVNGFQFLLSSEVMEFPREVAFVIKGFRGTVRSFQSQVKSRFNRNGTLMDISLQHQDPFIAMKMTNLLAKLFVRKSVEISGGESQRQAEIIKEQLATADRKLKASTQKLLNFRKSDISVLDLSTQASTFLKKKDEAETKRDALLQSQSALNELLQQAELIEPDGTSRTLLERNSIFFELIKLPIFNANASLAIPKGKLVNLGKEYRDIVNVTSEVNDKAVELAQQLNDVHKQVESIARRENRNVSAKIRQFNTDIAAYDRQLKSLPAKESQYAELMRENKELQDIFNNLSSQYSNIKIKGGTDTEDIEILDPAIVPIFPINGNKKVKALIGLIGGFLIGIAATLAIEFLDKTMKTVNDVKKYLRVNVLGAIPEVDFKDVFDHQDSEKIKMIDNQLVTHDYSPSPIGEAYRSLRTSIMFSKDIGRVQTLVVTSMAPGDGKSFTSANLAITMAQQKSNTLLIDTDLRRGVLHNTFGLPKEPGFSNYLTSGIPVPELVHETHIPNLSIISCGSLIPNPSEVLGSHQMQRFLDDIRRRFDLIIFDTPPLNAATDAVVIGTQVDASVIVVRAGKTHRDVARQKMELYQHIPAKVIGVILNGTHVDLAHEGYSYYHY
ncbi:MAG: polysaccharide biosynthesis tyrosine autokinase [bacterium]